MKNLFFTFFFAMMLLSCKHKSDSVAIPQNSNTALYDTLTKNLASAYEKEALVGFSVAVVDENGLLYENGFGFTDLAQKKSYTSKTVQNIGSISKTLIGISLFKAQELGKLDLDDPINKYLPFKIVNPHHPEIPILIKHLAYHTATILDLDEVYAKSYVLTSKEQDEKEVVFEYFNKASTHIPVSDFMKNSLAEDGKWYTPKSFSKAKPGEVYEYSNIGAALCALVLENATGHDYRSFTKEHILKPLKLNTSGWSSEDIDVTMRSKLFYDTSKVIADYELITFADGGFVTSSHDLGLYLAELMRGYYGTGILLNKESYEQLYEKKSFITNDKKHEVGVFMEFRDGFLHVKNEMIGHNGSDPGVFTAMYFNPKTKMGKVILVNTDTDSSDKIWPEIEAIWKSLSDYETATNKKVDGKSRPNN